MYNEGSLIGAKQIPSRYRRTRVPLLFTTHQLVPPRALVSRLYGRATMARAPLALLGGS